MTVLSLKARITVSGQLEVELPYGLPAGDAREPGGYCPGEAGASQPSSRRALLASPSRASTSVGRK